MNCKNILIVYFDEKDDETKDAIDLLNEKYADRNRNTIKYSHDSGGPCFVPEGPKWEPTKGDTGIYDTGIYVIQHGAGLGGASDRGFARYLAEEAVRKAFAKWLLSLAGPPKSLKIRKLCFIACRVVQTDDKGLKANAVSAAGGPKGEVFVQQICHAISEIDTEKKLNGLMVAGYTAGVSIVKEIRDRDVNKPEIIPKRIFKATQRYVPQKPNDSLDRPMHPAQDSSLHAWRKGQGFERKITAYVERKRIFVLQDGEWRVGKLSEYSDKDEAWKEAWKAKLEKLERASKVFE
jgi:hypothetical protein